MPVRTATRDDIDSMVNMGSLFLTRTRYSQLISLRHDEYRNALELLLEHGRIWVAEIDGVVCGFLAAIRQPIWFMPSKSVALETIWWMEEAHRGRPEGVRLLLEFERWAKDQEVCAICVSDIIVEGGSAAERILLKLGYSPNERMFVKGT
jgi:GNAT superfamily N-acetyltransferase